MQTPPLPTDTATLARELQPVLDTVEKGRQYSLARIHKGWKSLGITILLTAIIFVFIVMASGSRGEFGIVALLVAFIGVVCCIIIYNIYIIGHKSTYRIVYKTKVIKAITQLIHPDMTYSPERGISEETFKEMGLYSTGVDRYHSEDLFAGKIGKTAMMFSEAHAEERQTSTDSKGNTSTSWVTIFKGLLTIVDFNKDFRSWVIIKPDFAENNFGWLGRKFQGLSPNLIRLENQEFEKAFVVHGSDQVEARYILTPDLQDRLLDLRRVFGKDIRMAFYNSRMHLTIPNQNNWFEPDINCSAHDITQMRMVISQMTSIFKIITLLDLNKRIWTKD